MKRSQINALIKDAAAFIEGMGFRLPPFAYFSPDKWREVFATGEYDEIRDNMLGWDVTDFGSGDFEKTGLLLFTVRNGNESLPGYQKPYAEKILVAGEGQVTPYHYHHHKMEDIINRGGGNLAIRLYNSADAAGGKIAAGRFADTDVTVLSDGRRYALPAGSIVTLKPGESITLYTGLYHSFWGEGGQVLVGEVSKVNDDRADNRFYAPAGRFPEVEEDAEPLFLLSFEYPKPEEGRS